MIGAEGTLAFIAEAVLETVPDLPVKYTGLLLFPDFRSACDAIVPLRDAGAAALEVMDRASLRSVENKPGIPSEIKQLPDGAAGLLVEFQSADRTAIQENAAKAEAAVEALKLLYPAEFTSEAVYFPACISRIMGALPDEQQETSVMQALLSVAERAGVQLCVPSDISGNCCGVPFSSKGYEAAHHVAIDRTIENFFRWSNGGELPIIVDTSPCTHGLKTARSHLSPENQARFDKLTILDSIEFAHDRLLPRLTIRRKVHSVALHAVCFATKMAITPKLIRISEACSDTVLVPRDAGCCAFAGDRGFLFPELTAAATSIEAAQAITKEHDGYYSSSRTCEIGMTRATGKVYQSYLHLLDYATRPENQEL